MTLENSSQAKGILQMLKLQIVITILSAATVFKEKWQTL